VGSERRQVTYTTLPAGTYTFRAQGATKDGPWSEPGVALRIKILPPWWNTTPFFAAVGAALFLIAWVGYRQRVHQVARQFEARLGERTRIARDLHDTLLQSFQASLFQMEAARNILSRRPEQAVQTLDEAINMAEGAIAESRDAIQDLRSQPPSQGDLAHLLTVTGQELARSQDTSGNPVIFRVTVEGERQELDPLLQDDAYRIARELLRNAFRHARASQIEAEIRYDDAQLRVRIRDNGKGIEPEMLTAGRAGHWGLLGMRERAKRIGGRLDFWSGAGAGTEVELSVPSSIAYRAARTGWRFQLLPKKKANS
jgi:signal transduction histidine kinase